MRNKNNWNLPHCLDCNKRLNDYRGIRCRECSYSQMKLDNKKSFCLDCGKKLFDYRTKRCRVCANLGKNNPAFGTKRSIEARKLTSIKNKGHIGFMKGKHHSEKTIKKMSEAHKKRVLEGKCHLWKGGITPFNLAERVRFRQTIQKKVLERDDYICQLCGIKGGILHVDHIQSWAEYVELRFCIDNCRTLCMACHYKITYGKPMPPSVRAWGQNLKGGNIEFVK